jgi:hypothetical protein
LHEPNKPNLIIAGVNKAATTSLFMYLSAHPQICSSRIKETQYFLPLRYGINELSPIDDYWQQFSHCIGADYILESTAGYFYGGEKLARAIQDILGRVKIVLIFRDPITRMFSFFKFQKSMLEIDKSITFSKYIEMCESMSPEERNKRANNVYWGIDGGFYSKYLPGWYSVFGEDNLKIFFFENFIADPLSQLTTLCKWLDLEHEDYIKNLETSIENKTQNYRNRFIQNIALKINWRGESFWRSHPRLKKSLRGIYYAINAAENEDILTNEHRTHLDAIFQPYNLELARELDQKGYTNLPGWLKKEINKDQKIDRVHQISNKNSGD